MPKWLAGTLSGLMGVLAVAGAIILTPGPAPIPPGPEPEPVAHAFGWCATEAEAAVPEVLRSLPQPSFSGTPAYCQTADPPEYVYLWDAARKVSGSLIPPRNQGQVGSCVSFGTGSAIEHLMYLQILMGGTEEFRDLSQEVIYGGSRVQIGGGKIRGDGSVGAWAAKWVQQYGVVARGKYPGYDLSTYSESTCRAFGSRGCPKDLEPIAKLTPVRSVTQVKTVEEAKRALANGYPIAVCSGQGFASRRDADGFARAQGSWPHCMCILGYQTKRAGFFILNSWGTGWISGPVGAGDPSPAGFWAEASVVGRMLGEGDSWAFSDMKGFPARKIDWFVMPGPGVRGKKVSYHHDPFSLFPWRGRGDGDLSGERVQRPRGPRVGHGASGLKPAGLGTRAGEGMPVQRGRGSVSLRRGVHRRGAVYVCGTATVPPQRGRDLAASGGRVAVEREREALVEVSTPASSGICPAVPAEFPTGVPACRASVRADHVRRGQLCGRQVQRRAVRVS